MSVVMFSYAITVISLSAGLLVTFLGIPVLAAGLAGSRALGSVERARARALLDLDVADPAPLRAAKPGLMGWVGAVLKSGVSWRHLLYSLLHFPWALFAFVFSVTFWTVGWSLLTYPLWQWTLTDHLGQPGLQMWGDGHGNGVYVDSPSEIGITSAIGLLIVLAGPWVIRGLTQVDRVLVHGLLGPSSLANRVTELESDRGVVVDTAAADLRRIERDLHDGAQARLVALAMDLGLAKEKLTEDPEAAAKMVDEAHGEVKIALQELRDLARGIHPAILTDRGLGPALSALSARCTVPVKVTVDLSRPAGRRHRGHRVLHRLRAAAERLEARRGDERDGGCLAHRGPDHAAGDDNGHGGATSAPAPAWPALPSGSTRSTACWSWTPRRADRPPSPPNCPGGARGCHLARRQRTGLASAVGAPGCGGRPPVGGR